ncbi:hypothetical protein GJU40_05685 [Bacillus lacus]|uniref:Uncharacterized protein n=1 Tax=Metabacillus lacus TaxID=1983721 RepID=A0A7X2IXW1_9BACI|nr:hypothetical protein [Metabacillus lacus]MRX71665.1 hypothetical protein [Metabacillus lacus]
MFEKWTVLFVLQSVIWSGFMTVDTLSYKDGVIAKTILLFIFIYFAYLVGMYVIRSARHAVFATVLTMAVFLGGKQIYSVLLF